MQNMPDWSDFRYLLEVARTGTLTAAALRLGVDQVMASATDVQEVVGAMPTTL